MPAGYVRPSLSQVRQADEMAFVLMAEFTSEGLQQVTARGTPMDDAIDKVLADMRFTMRLLPERATRNRERQEQDTTPWRQDQDGRERQGEGRRQGRQEGEEPASIRPRSARSSSRLRVCINGRR